MKYALRKLIAFVFLLGLFWYVYRDPSEVWDSDFRASIAVLVLAFGAFWLIVPQLVVWVRIWKRTRKNRRGYDFWIKETGSEGPRPHRRNRRLNIDPAEEIWFHEKGTFYVHGNPSFAPMTVRGRIGDVAFPREPRAWRKSQRVHCYFTGRRILFLGKEIDCDIRLDEVLSFHDTVGGIVFDVRKDGHEFSVAFTFVNPLIAAHVLRFLQKNK